MNLLSMSRFTRIEGEARMAGASDFDFNRNMLTTAGVIAGATTVGGVAAIGTIVFPAQVLGGGALSAGLLYAGHRQAKGMSINPFTKPEAITEVKQEAAQTA